MRNLFAVVGVGALAVILISFFQNCSGTLSGPSSTSSSVDLESYSAIKAPPVVLAPAPVPVPPPPLNPPPPIVNPNPADFKCGFLYQVNSVPQVQITPSALPFISCRNAPVVENAVASRMVEAAIGRKPIECVYVRHPLDPSVNLRCLVTKAAHLPILFLNHGLASRNIYVKLKIIVSTPNVKCYGRYVGQRVGFAAYAIGSKTERVEYNCEVLNPAAIDQALTEIRAYFLEVKGGSLSNSSTGLVSMYGDFSLGCKVDPMTPLAVAGKTYITCTGDSLVSQLQP